ncbi:MAG: sulfurtransferase [Pseudomonadota bacterium]
MPDHDFDHANLISARALHERFDRPSLRVIDASWRLPGDDQQSAYEAFLARHIPGAYFFDIDEIADRTSSLPHMMPPPERFTRAARALSIDHDSDLIIYDDQGLFSAPRVWWTFKAMGHRQVCVLDGGLPAWLAAGLPTDKGDPRQSSGGTFTAEFDPSLIADADAVRDQLSRKEPVLDARPAARFCGDAPEPRANLRRGHMPGADNVPFKSLLAEAGTLRPAADLRARLMPLLGAEEKGKSMPITTCGSGITAAVINLALTVAGLNPGRLYDGAWAEWGETRRPATAQARYPVTTGAQGRDDE